MVGYLIYEFETEGSAHACLQAVNALAVQYWTEQGYTVIDGENGKELIGKKNGVDAPESAHTLTWDSVKESPDNTWYFASLSSDERFAAATQQLIDAGFTFTERSFPAAWNVSGEI